VARCRVEWEVVDAGWVREAFGAGDTLGQEGGVCELLAFRGSGMGGGRERGSRRGDRGSNDGSRRVGGVLRPDMLTLRMEATEASAFEEEPAREDMKEG